MSISERLLNNLIKLALIILTIIIMSIYQKVNAQDKDVWETSIFSYSGIEGSLGVKTTQVNSNIPELNNMFMVQEGGNIGAVIGNDFSVFVLRPLGFYSAAGSVGRTINLFAVEAENNTYLIKGIFKKRTRLDIYSSLGLNFHSYKFFGHYIKEDLRPSKDPKPGREPFLGKIESLNISYGLGLEYNLVKNGDFLNMFLTAKSTIPVENFTNSEAFTETYYKKHLDISIGVRFGLMQISKERLLASE